MRLASSAALALTVVLLAPSALPQSVRLVVQNSPLAGLRYYAAAEVRHDLRVGDPVELEREAENPHDPNAIAVRWRGRKLGYVPRRDNATLAWALDRGERLRARISQLAANPRRRIEVEVFLE
jgi:hypothetical protein